MMGHDATLFAALDAFVRQIVREEISRARSTGGSGGAYSQRDGERPIGCGKPTYSRVWHRAFDASDPGAWREGRSLIMTAEAWQRWATLFRTRAPRAPAPVASPVTGLDALLAEAGARLVPSDTHRKQGR
jgi:hypothetical protein